jgi:3-methyladenine DNA glycosylase AlkD
MEFQVEKLCEEIQDRLQSLAELRTEQIRKIRREYSRTLDSKDAAFVISLALGLIRTGDVISRIVAYELILNHVAALQSVGEKELVQLGLGMDSWGAVDTFGCYVAGPVWRAGQVPDRLIHSWTQSDDRWWRRAALVSTVPLNNKARGGLGDPAARWLSVHS